MLLGLSFSVKCTLDECRLVCYNYLYYHCDFHMLTQDVYSRTYNICGSCLLFGAKIGFVLLLKWNVFYLGFKQILI